MYTCIIHIDLFSVHRVEHWDVNNEDIHGDFYEQKTGNANVTMDMFRDVHAVDPDVKLFLNEFGILENTVTVVLVLHVFYLYSMC